MYRSIWISSHGTEKTRGEGGKSRAVTKLPLARHPFLISRGEGHRRPRGSGHRDPLIMPVRKAAFKVRLEPNGARLHMPRPISGLRPQQVSGPRLENFGGDEH